MTPTSLKQGERKRELKYCDICVQMTNHLKDLCLKCRNVPLGYTTTSASAIHGSGCSCNNCKSFYDAQEEIKRNSSENNSKLKERDLMWTLRLGLYGTIAVTHAREIDQIITKAIADSYADGAKIHEATIQISQQMFVKKLEEEMMNGSLREKFEELFYKDNIDEDGNYLDRASTTNRSAALVLWGEILQAVKKFAIIKK